MHLLLYHITLLNAYLYTLHTHKRGPWLGSWTAAPKMGSFFVPVNSTVRGNGRRLLNWSKSHWFGHPRAGASPMFQKVLVP